MAEPHRNRGGANRKTLVTQEARDELESRLSMERVSFNPFIPIQLTFPVISDILHRLTFYHYCINCCTFLQEFYVWVTERLHKQFEELSER